MNIQELRKSLKQKWLCYYQQNRHWLEKMQIWAVFQGERRPLSSFVLATVSVLEPNLNDMLPLLVDLNTNPDDMIAALGLNFNPEKELKQLDVNEHESESYSLQETSSKHPENQRVIQIRSYDSSQHEVETKSSSVKDTVADKNRAIQVAVATSYLNQSQSLQPLQSVTFVTPTSKRDIPVSAIAIAPLISKTSDYKLTSSTITSEVKQLPTVNRHKLANWIDEFCQGRDWDRDESIFIPF
jgi:Family of unknown function (DUF5331)